MTTRWIKQSAESKCIRLIEKFQCDTIRGLGDVLYLLHAAFIGNCFTDILNIVIPVYGQANLVQKRTHCTGLQRLLFSPPLPLPSPPLPFLHRYRPRTHDKAYSLLSFLNVFIRHGAIHHHTLRLKVISALDIVSIQVVNGNYLG